MLKVAETNDRKMLLTTNASLKADAKRPMSNDLDLLGQYSGSTRSRAYLQNIEANEAVTRRQVKVIKQLMMQQLK